MRPRSIPDALLNGDRKSVNPLDAIEANALDYLVAMDLQQLDLHYALGTDEPRVGRSGRVPVARRDPALPGPEGIDRDAVSDGTRIPCLWLPLRDAPGYECARAYVLRTLHSSNGQFLVQHLIQGMAAVDRKGGDRLAPRFWGFPTTGISSTFEEGGTMNTGKIVTAALRGATLGIGAAMRRSRRSRSRTSGCSSRCASSEAYSGADGEIAGDLHPLRIHGPGQSGRSASTL